MTVMEPVLMAEHDFEFRDETLFVALCLFFLEIVDDQELDTWIRTKDFLINYFCKRDVFDSIPDGGDQTSSYWEKKSEYREVLPKMTFFGNFGLTVF